MALPVSNLDDVLTPHRSDETTFEMQIADGWQQGRGAFGGLVLGGMVRALSEQLGDTTRKLRSLTAEIVGPVQVGPAAIEVELLRQGNAVSAWRAVLRQGEGVQAHAVGVFGAARAAAPSWQRLVPPVMPPWEGVEAIPAESPFAPVFTRHFEYRPTGPLPFFAGPPEAAGWVRPRLRATRLDDAYLTALADAWWLAGMAALDGPRPFATLSFSLDCVGDLGALDPEVPLFHRAVAPVSHEGYVSEYRELWGHDGRLIALNHQTTVLIK
jgi:acyl-CoA thioesterase